MVLADVGGVKVPFYNTTGKGGKKETKVGQWYPAMGIGREGWINKTHGADMAEYYKSPELKEVAEHLNSRLGDMTTPDKIKSLPAVSVHSTSHIKALNEHMKVEPAHDYDSPKALETVQANVEHIRSSVAGRQWGFRKQ